MPASGPSLPGPGRLPPPGVSAVLWDGTNVDDLADFRPGFRALREQGVESPLLMAGLGKAAIRTLSRDLGLDGGALPELPGHPLSL